MDTKMMDLALQQAREGLAQGGVPVGAVLAANGQVLGAGHNQRVQQGDAVAHGEISALRDAGRRPDYAGSTMYTTLSPCAMCSGAILLYGIKTVIVGENQTFVGEEGLLRSRGVSVTVLQDADCIRLMTEFIRTNLQLWNEDIGV